MTHKCPKNKGDKCTCPPGKILKGAKKKAAGGKKRPLNAYMKKVMAARSSKAASFEYNGKTYYRKMTKTGMAVYSLKGGAKK